jgi:hypothetical protein
MHQTPILFGKEKVIPPGGGKPLAEQSTLPCLAWSPQKAARFGRKGEIYDSLIHVILNISFYLSCQQKSIFFPIPREISEEIDQIAGKRKRSLFIADATREKLQRERFLRTLEETRWAWNDKNHPELKTAKDVELYVSDKRQSYRKRLKRITHE